MNGLFAFKKLAALAGVTCATVVLVGSTAVANGGGSFAGAVSVNNCDPDVSAAGCTDILPTNILAVNRVAGPTNTTGTQTVITLPGVPDGHYKVEAKTLLTGAGTSLCTLTAQPGGVGPVNPVDVSSYSPGMTSVNENLIAALDLESSSATGSTIRLDCSFGAGLWSATWSKIILQNSQFFIDTPVSN